MKFHRAPLTTKYLSFDLLVEYYIQSEFDREFLQCKDNLIVLLRLSCTSCQFGLFCSIHRDTRTFYFWFWLNLWVTLNSMLLLVSWKKNENSNFIDFHKMPWNYRCHRKWRAHSSISFSGILCFLYFPYSVPPMVRWNFTDLLNVCHRNFDSLWTSVEFHGIRWKH